jgi:hypothetical protein
MIYPSVIYVKPLENFKVEIKFDTNETKIFDMKPYLNKGKFKELTDPENFKKVKVKFDSIEWSNGIDIDPELLYEKGIIVL